MKILAGLLALMVSAPSAWAQDLEVPEEELAKETVLPRFERGEAVKARNVVTAKAFEVGGYLGWNFTEPIYNQTKFGLNVGYHFSEQSAFSINFVKWMPGRNTQYTDLLRKLSLDFDRVPDINYSIWGNYELHAYYGKISLTKKGVLNLHLYPILGAGITGYVHKPYPGINFGLGQKFYFTNKFALRADFKLQYQQGPSPFLGGGRLNTNNSVQPAPSEFKDKWSLGTILDVGVSYLL